MKTDRWWYERISTIGKRGALMREDGLDEGHELLVRFVDDLKAYIGIPTTDCPHAIALGADGVADYRRKYDKVYFALPAAGSAASHECWMDVDIPGNPKRRFRLDAQKGAEKPPLWHVVIDGEALTVGLDASDYGVAEDAIEEALGRIIKALHAAMWQRT